MKTPDATAKETPTALNLYLPPAVSRQFCRATGGALRYVAQARGEAHIGGRSCVEPLIPVMMKGGRDGGLQSPHDE